MRVRTLCLILSLAGCKTDDGAELKNTTVISFEGELGMRPGVGFESIFEDVRGSCVDFDGTETFGTAQTVTYELDLVESHRELGTSLNVSNAAQVKAAVPDTPATVSAKTKFMLGHSYTLNRYSIFLLTKVEVRNEATHLKNAKLKEEKKTQLANAAQDPDAVDRFRLQCGDAYLGAFTTGGEFFGVIELETESDEHKAEIKREVEAAIAAEGVGEVNTQSSFEAKLTRATRNKKLKIWTYQRGGSGSAQVGLVDTPEKMIERVRKFPDFVVAGQGGNAANYTATFKDYFTLDVPLPTAYRDQLLSAQDIMAELAGIQAQLVDRRGDIDYVLGHPNSFEGLTDQKKTELTAARAANTDLMKKIWKTARDCHRKFRECRITEDLQPKPLELPRRKTTIQQLKTDMIVLKTQMQTIDVDALYDGPWNPPDCYLEIRVKGPNAGKFKRIRRTPPDFNTPRCDELNKTFELPLALLKQSMVAAGASEDDAEIEILVMDDDPGPTDQVIGRISKKYKDVTRDAALLDTLTGPHVTMSVEMQVQ